MTIIMMIALFENKGFFLLEKFLKASSQNFPIKIKYPSVIHPLTHSRINTLTHSNEFREHIEQEKEYLPLWRGTYNGEAPSVTKSYAPKGLSARNFLPTIFTNKQ